MSKKSEKSDVQNKIKSSEEVEEDYKKIIKILENFKGYLEVKSFRDFLLALINSPGDIGLIERLMGGGSNQSLYYNLDKKCFTFNLIPYDESIIVYFHKENDLEKQVIKEDDSAFFLKYLSNFEYEEFVKRHKIKFNIINFINYTKKVNSKYDVKANFEIVHVFADLLSFIFAIGEDSPIFVYEGNGDEPDLYFSFSISLSNLVDGVYSPVLAYLDYSKIGRENNYLKIENKTLKIEGIPDMKNISHSERFNNLFSLLIHIKSFEEL